MITLTFDLNYEKMAQDGITEEDMLNPMREYAKKYDINELRKGVFERSDEHGKCLLAKYILDKCQKDNIYYIDYFNTWILRDDEEPEGEDAVITMMNILIKKGLR